MPTYFMEAILILVGRFNESVFVLAASLDSIISGDKAPFILSNVCSDSGGFNKNPDIN